MYLRVLFIACTVDLVQSVVFQKGKKYFTDFNRI